MAWSQSRNVQRSQSRNAAKPYKIVAVLHIEGLFTLVIGERRFLSTNENITLPDRRYYVKQRNKMADFDKKRNVAANVKMCPTNQIKE